MMDNGNQKDIVAVLPGLIRCPPIGMDVLQQFILMLNTILTSPLPHQIAWISTNS